MGRLIASVSCRARLFGTAALFWTLGFAPVQAQEADVPPARVAIVVGNQDYATIKDLPNAARDAADMAATLRQFGFDVHAGTDLDRRGFEALIRDALLNLPQGSEVVFFYAGHGIQIGARNYLLPTDVAFDDVNDLPLYSITLDRVVEAFAARGSVHVVFIDACRDNPFPGVKLTTELVATLAETGQGFSAFPAPLNSLVAFSTSPGQTAVDGPEGGNSPYTTALMSTVKSQPGQELAMLLPRIREQVYTSTGGLQVPWESSTLVQPFLFTAQGTEAIVEVPEEPANGSIKRGGIEAEPIALSAMLDRSVDLTKLLAEAGVGPLENVSVPSLPVNGDLNVLAGGKLILYRPALREIRATEIDAHAHTDRLILTTGPEDARREITVDLTLTADPCDVEAGDALDMEGVGLFRLPNEIDADAALAACQAAIDANPDTWRFRYQLGRAQLAMADLPAALASFQLASNAAHTRAWTAQANLLLSEKIDRDLSGIKADPTLGFELLERGVKAGDPFAIHGLGLRLMTKGQTPEERQRGFELLDRAAELGHTYSMNTLGIHFLTKDTADYQPERGMTYLRASYDRDDIYGMHNLGFVALYGLDGQEPDPARAAPFFEAAALGGHPNSPASLGRMIMRDQLGPADHAKAVTWYDMGLARGDGWGGANGAEVILKGQIPGLGPADAAARAAKAALLFDPKAAEAAQKVLGKLDKAAIGGGIQTLLADLGLAITVDGNAGPATRQALEEAAKAAGLASKAGNDTERLLLAARIWWKKHPVRPDVF